jgi:hypothetical protein
MFTAALLKDRYLCEIFDPSLNGCSISSSSVKVPEQKREKGRPMSVASFATKVLPSWAQQSSFVLPLEPPTSSAASVASPAESIALDLLVQGFADYIWVVVKEATARTHGVVAHGAIAGVAGGALDAPQDRSDVVGHHDDEFPSDDEDETASSRFAPGVAPSVMPPQPPATSSGAPMPPVESEVILGSRDEALVNVLNAALVGSIAVSTGDPRPVVSCLALHTLAKSLKSPAARQHAVSRIVAEVVALSKLALR